MFTLSAMPRALAAILAGTLLLSGCFDDEPETERNTAHVWKDQTRSLEKARDVANTLQDAAAKQRQQSQ